MKLETAIKYLKKEAEFLGLTFEQVILFIEKNGTNTCPLKTKEAFETYKLYV
jgi:hypothetical protein